MKKNILLINLAIFFAIIAGGVYLAFFHQEPETLSDEQSFVMTTEENQAEKNESTVYTNNELSITFPTPYEPAHPSSQGSGSVVFGPYGMIPEGPTDEQTRQYYFIETQQRSKEEIVKIVEEDSLAQYKDVITVGGKEVVRYVEGGLCVYPKLEIIGESANYLIFPVCGSGSEEEFTYMTNVAQTIQFN